MNTTIKLNTEERRAIRDILRYIEKQPHAKHSAEGIAKYWIFQQRLEEHLNVAFGAIHYLVRKGFLQDVIKSDGSRYFQVNTQKLEDIPAELSMLDPLDRAS